MSDANRAEADRLREELSRREAEMTYRQANGEDFRAVHDQVMTLRQQLAKAEGRA